jgi:hypothetical protein
MGKSKDKLTKASTYPVPKKRVKVAMDTSTRPHDEPDVGAIRRGWSGRKGKRKGMLFDDPHDWPLTMLAVYVPEGWITLQEI